MEIITYHQKYESETVDLWNRCCTFDPIDVKKFRKQALFDDNFDEHLCWLALDQEKVVGFLLAMKRVFPYLERGTEPDRGWINVIFVAPEYRKNGIGQKMYDLAEGELRARGAKNITLGAYSPSYFFAGLDPDHYPESISFFEKNGYIGKEQHYSMGKSLHGYSIPEQTLAKKQAAEAKGYSFIPFNYQYSIELLEFLKQEFGGGWKRNALIAMQNETAQDLILLVLDKDQKICGFCMRAIDGRSEEHTSELSH